MFETIVNLVLAFLLGAVLTAFGYTLVLSKEVSVLSTNIKNAVDKLDGVCTNQTGLTAKLDNLAERTARLEERSGIKS